MDETLEELSEDELDGSASEELDNSAELLDTALEELGEDELDDSASEELDNSAELLDTSSEELGEDELDDSASEELNNSAELLDSALEELRCSSSTGPVEPLSPPQPHNSIANASPGNKILCMIALLHECSLAGKDNLCRSLKTLSESANEGGGKHGGKAKCRGAAVHAKRKTAAFVTQYPPPASIQKTTRFPEML